MSFKIRSYKYADLGMALSKCWKPKRGRKLTSRTQSKAPFSGSLISLLFLLYLSLGGSDSNGQIRAVTPVVLKNLPSLKIIEAKLFARAPETRFVRHIPAYKQSASESAERLQVAQIRRAKYVPPCVRTRRGWLFSGDRDSKDVGYGHGGTAHSRFDELLLRDSHLGQGSCEGDIG